MKALFIPLKKKYFMQFKNGEKKFEYRGYGKAWTEKSCVIGRECYISCGYNGERIKGAISSLEVVHIDDSPIEAQEIYQGKYERIAKIGINLYI
ncbi:TPA: hypothetical protein QB220_000476 [Pasteurella multocida]|nr:hypothetical protein [Pasteurella multocida]